MTWLDLVTLVSFALLVALASKRGVILEVTDIVCIIGGGLFAFRGYRPIASGLHGSIFGGFSIEFLQKFALFGLFIVVSMAIFAVGLTIRRRAKEEKYLESDVDEKLGIVVGIFKSFLLIMLVLGLMFYKDAFPERETRKLKKGAVVSKLIGLSGAVAPVVYVVAPLDLAKDFMKYGLGPFKKRPKKKPKKKKKKKKKKK